jgi:rhodanese-related sulfurtransferase
MVEEVPPGEVEAKLDEDGVQVVDIRPPGAFEQGHIPGATNIPMSELPRRVDDYEWKDEVVVVCPVGQSSVQAARLIRSFEGVDEDTTVASMRGGYQQWESDLESGPESAEERA